MKLTILFISILILLLQFGCKQTTEPGTPDIYVSFEIEHTFENDSVQLSLDNKILLDSSVTTNFMLGLAWSSRLRKLSRNNHQLNFAVVEYGAQKDYTVDTSNDTSTVLLRFDRSTNQISIEQIKGRVPRF